MIGGPNSAPFEASTNAVFLGKEKSGSTLLGAAITTEDAFSIDQKMDDGVVNGNLFNGAKSGSVRSVDGDDVPTESCVLSSSKSYNIGNKAFSCRIGIELN